MLESLRTAFVQCFASSKKPYQFSAFGSIPQNFGRPRAPVLLGLRLET